MKRLVLMLLRVLILGVVTTTAMTSKVFAACTPTWKTVQARNIFVIDHDVFVPLGSVSLERDGCGDIQALLRAYDEGITATSGSLTIYYVATNTTVFTSTNLQGHGVVRGITSPVFAGYGGIGIAVTGSLTTPSYGTVSATTPTDNGS
jgi:hypothetical protein